MPPRLAARLAARLALGLAVGSPPCVRCLPVLCSRRQKVSLGVHMTVDNLRLDIAPGNPEARPALSPHLSRSTLPLWDL